MTEDEDRNTGYIRVSPPCFPSDLSKKHLWIEEFVKKKKASTFSTMYAADFSGMGTQLKALIKTLDARIASRVLKSEDKKNYKTGVVLSIVDLAFDAAITEPFLHHSSYQKVNRMGIVIR